MRDAELDRGTGLPVSGGFIGTAARADSTAVLAKVAFDVKLTAPAVTTLRAGVGGSLLGIRTDL